MNWHSYMLIFKKIFNVIFEETLEPKLQYNTIIKNKNNLSLQIPFL
jgi:hypothetical protein